MRWRRNNIASSSHIAADTAHAHPVHTRTIHEHCQQLNPDVLVTLQLPLHCTQRLGLALHLTLQPSDSIHTVDQVCLQLGTARSLAVKVLLQLLVLSTQD